MIRMRTTPGIRAGSGHLFCTATSVLGISVCANQALSDELPNPVVGSDSRGDDDAKPSLVLEGHLTRSLRAIAMASRPWLQIDCQRDARRSYSSFITLSAPQADAAIQANSRSVSESSG